MSLKSSLAVSATIVLLASLFVLPADATVFPCTGIQNCGFELDGNAVASTGEDWSTLFPTNTSTTVFSETFATDTPPGDTTYFSIGSKDINDVSTWSATGSSAPDKDEITHAYAATYNSTGSNRVYFGMDRFANNGDSNVGFWFLQDLVNITATGSFTGHHRQNDTLIVSTFTTGGTIANITVYKWVGNASAGHLQFVVAGADCSTASATAALCAIVNGAVTNSPWPFTPKSGPANKFQAGELFEGGINLTAIYGNVPCFLNMVAETRSSQQTTATLKDLVLHKFNNCILVPPESAFDLLKTAVDPIVPLGSPVQFNITLANGGPDTSFDTNLTDVLPPVSGSWSVSGDNASFCGITGSAPAQTLTCHFGAVGVFDSRAITITGPTGVVSDCGLQPNTVRLDTDDNLSQTQFSNASVYVLCSDPSVLKTAVHDTVSLGSDIAFDLTLFSNGPDNATNAMLSDTLPTVGTGWSVSGANAGDCSITAGVLSCSFGTVVPGDSRTVTVNATTASVSDCGTWRNVATVSADIDTDLTNDSSAAQVTVQCPGLTLEKVSDASSVSAGSAIGFGIYLNNTGNGTATAVTLNDPLPTGSGVSWSVDVDSTGTACGIDLSGTLVCSYGDIAGGGSRYVHVTSATTGDSCQVYHNVASATASNQATLQAEANETVLCPTLNIVKTADAASVSAGSSIGFTITVNNTGSGTATGVSVNDTLPTGTGISWSIDSDPLSACLISGGELLCSFGDLTSGSSASVHITSGTTFDSCAVITNFASANATNAGVVTSSDSTTVLCPALTVLKTADAASVSAGDPIGFTLYVNNTGSGDATGVDVNDPLPIGSGISWTIASDSTGGLCSITAGTLDCAIGTLPAAAHVTVHVTSPTDATSCSVYGNTVNVTATNHPSLNASASTTVVCPSLTIEKRADAASVMAGQAIGFTIYVNNTGSGTAKGVTVNDTLPTGSGITWSTSSAGCSVTAGVLLCSLGDIGSGSGASAHVTSPTDSTSCAVYPNIASANATNAGVVTSSASTTVNCPTGATRTLGFWATHTAYTEGVFTANLSGTMLIGTGSHVRTIDTYGKLFGGFYASIPYKSDGHKRNAVDQARVTLLQQLIAAKLNCAAFGCSASTQTLIAQADTAYAGNDRTAMANLTAQLDAYNQSGDGVDAGNTGSATPDQSQAIANIPFWDNP